MGKTYRRKTDGGKRLENAKKSARAQRAEQKAKDLARERSRREEEANIPY